MKVSRMTFTGKRDNRKFNRIRGGYSIVVRTNRVAKVISYRLLQDGKVSISCLVDNGNLDEHKWQMVRNTLPSNSLGVVSKREANRVVEIFETIYGNQKVPQYPSANRGSSISFR